MAGLQRLAAVEGIDDYAAVAFVHAHQEVAGEGEAIHRPALGAGGVDVEDAEADREARAAVDDLQQVRVLGCVVAVAVAGIAVRLEEHGVEVAAPALQRLVLPGERRHVGAEPADVVAVGVERGARLVEGAEQQRGVRQVDLLVGTGADRAQRALDRGCGHQGPVRRHGRRCRPPARRVEAGAIRASPGDAGRPS